MDSPGSGMPSTRWTASRVVLAAILAGVSLSIPLILARGRRAETVSFERTSHLSAEANHIRAEARSEISVSFKASNGTSRDRKLQVHSSCNCNIVRQLPDLLPQGETAEFAVRLLVPPVGGQRYPIRVQDVETDEVCFSTTMLVEADVHPPALVAVPDLVRLRKILGHPVSQVIVVDTVERDRDSPWIKAVVPDESSPIRLAMESRDARPGSDYPDALVCRYVFRISLEAESAGGSTTIHLVAKGSGETESSTVASIPVLVEPFDSVVIAPRRLVMAKDGKGGDPRKINLLSNDGSRLSIDRIEFDDKRLVVSADATDGPSLVLTVRLTDDVSGWTERGAEAEILVFLDGEDSPRRIPVALANKDAARQAASDKNAANP